MGDSREGRRVTIATSPVRSVRSYEYDDYTDSEDQARLFHRQNGGRRFSTWVSCGLKLPLVCDLLLNSCIKNLTLQKAAVASC